MRKRERGKKTMNKNILNVSVKKVWMREGSLISFALKGV